MQSLCGERGATLIDVVVGTALMLVVFVGIAGAFRLSIDAVLNNKARAGAIALANERLEYIRSLNYDAVGVVGGIPAGLIPQTEGVNLNGVTYTRRTYVSYQDDPGDGQGSADTNGIVTDYKAVKSVVQWDSRQGTRTISLTTRISPPTGIEYAVPGGTLSIAVVDANAQPVANAQVNIVNTTVSPVVDLTLFTNMSGVADVLGAPPASGYRVTVTKSGYSTARTYAADSVNTNPNPANLAVALNQTTIATFAIDMLATLHVATLSPIEPALWQDEFTSPQNIDPVSTVFVSGGVIAIQQAEGSYASTADYLSLPISVARLSEWLNIEWSDTEPSGTQVRVFVHDASGALIPDTELPGNSTGFTSSPVTLASISTTTHPSLRVGATLTSNDPAVTPSIDLVTLNYASGPTPLPNIAFTLQGAKTIGSTASGNLVYKYDREDHATEADGTVSLENIEWDVYTLAVASSTTYDIASSCAPQPVEVPPGASITNTVYLIPHTPHSLLVDVRASDSSSIPNAQVRLTRSGFSRVDTTDACGVVFFPGLTSGTVGAGNPYSIEVVASGYQTFSANDVIVSGTSDLTIILTTN